MGTAKQPKREKRPLRMKSFSDECIPVTPEQMHLASKVAHAAATGKMPRESFRCHYDKAKEAGDLEPGEYLVLNDLPMNHAAFAILETFNADKKPESEALARSLLWRVTFAAPKVYKDPRAQRYLRSADGGSWIGRPLIEAFASTTMLIGKEVPLDEVFAKAAKLADEEKWDPDASVEGCDS